MALIFEKERLEADKRAMEQTETAAAAAAKSKAEVDRLERERDLLLKERDLRLISERRILKSSPPAQYRRPIRIPIIITNP